MEIRIKILESSNVENIGTFINEYIDDGWKMQGGVVPHLDAVGHQYYAQTMIKEN